MLQEWGSALVGSFQVLWDKIAYIVPNVVIAVIIFIAGWVVGSLVGRLVEEVFKSLKVDNALKSAGVEDLTNRAGIKLSSGRFFGDLVKWFVILAFLMASFDVLQLKAVTDSLQIIVVEKLPEVIIASLILMVSFVVADVIKKLIIASARAAGIHSANFIGNAAKWVIWIFAVMVALAHVGIGGDLLLALFQGIVIAFSLAVGLSFGLGGQDAAKDYLNRIRDEIKSHVR